MTVTWTPEDLKAYENRSARLCPAKSQSAQGSALVGGVPRKEEGLPSSLLRNVHRYRIHFAVYSANPCDWDNAHIKFVQDAACKLGLLPSDSWQVLEGSISSYKAEKGEERTEVTITKIAVSKV